jgi:hypothetical protein
MTAAVGFSLHTGWAAAVVVVRDRHRIEVISRRRLELLPESAIPRFVYHRAAEICTESSLNEATALVESARAIVNQAAHKAIKELLQSIRIEVCAAGIPSSAKQADDGTSMPLEKILESHALIHAAEGRLFRRAVVDACERCGVPAVLIPARDVWRQVAELCGMEEGQFRREVDAIGKQIGPPWTADQKLATAAGLTAAAMLGAR